jgi:hypothetical protein
MVSLAHMMGQNEQMDFRTKTRGYPNGQPLRTKDGTKFENQ